MDAAGGTVDDGLGAALEDFQAVFFYWRMEATDDGNAVIAQRLGEIVGFEDEIAGAFDGAEEGDWVLGEEIEVADRMEGWWLFECGAGFEGDRIGVTLRVDGLQV